MKTKTILRIVLSSPSDVENEHQIIEEIISELNKGIANSFNILFEITRWKTDAYPGFHKEGPQGLIDTILDIENCDILIGIFWKHFGTPTKQALSGTEHEFINAYKSWQNKGLPQIMMYFKDTEVNFETSAEVEQYKKVMQFREEFPSDGLYWTFKDILQFERLVRIHLTQYLKHKEPDEYKVVETKMPKTSEQQIIQNYCQNLKQRFSTINLFGERNSAANDKQNAFDRMSHIDKGFVPLHLQDWLDENDNRETYPLEISDLFFSDDLPKHFLLRGLPGSGKTTLLRYLTYRFASMGVDGKKKCIPVYMRCKAFNINDSLEEFVMQQINEKSNSKICYNTLTAANLFLETPMVLLFDGLDEIENDKASKNFIQSLIKLKKNYPRCKIIVSSRPIKLQRDDFPLFRHLDVQRLEPEMINDYLDRWFGGNTIKMNDLKNTFEAKPRIQALATNPFLLSMICFTYENGGDTALIERRSDLYANCTKYLLQRRYDTSRMSNSEQDYIDILEILKDISLRFFLWQEADFPVDHVNVIGKRILTAEAIGKTADFLDDVQRKTGMIQHTKEGFTFVHRSLWEYFTALALQDKSLDFIIRHAANPDWEEVVRLYAGLLPENKQVISLVTSLWNINRPLAIRVTTEVQIPANDLIKPQIEKEEGNKSKLLLVDFLEQSLPLIPEAEQKILLHETLNILLIECAEQDCQVIYYAQQLLQKQLMSPLEPSGLIYRLLYLEHAAERQQRFLKDPDNCFEWIKIKGETFWMGDDEHNEDEKPAHQVKVSSFFITKHPVTNHLLSSFPFGKKHFDYRGDRHPAVGNTWFEAYYFALWINARLPTEAEWEYAARGGKHTEGALYYFGDSADELKDHAWFGETERQYAHAVDELNPKNGKENLNPLGLANMLGNVWEWCTDWYGKKYYDKCKKQGIVENPPGSETGSDRVLRGGSWSSFGQNCRSADRDYSSPDYRYNRIGFRLVFVP